MLKLVSDENFNGDILRGLRRRSPEIDIVRVQDAGLSAASDTVILEWAATENRILLTHDRETMPNFAYNRVRAGLAMPGVIVVDDQSSLGAVIEDILLADACLEPQECANLVRFLPW